MNQRIEEDWQNYPDEEYKYFLYERDNGMMFFKSIEDRNKWFESIKDSYLDDCWDEDVVNILAGEVTHITSEVNRIERPENLDENGYDSEGRYWHPEWMWMCNYELKPLVSE